nr:trigger factor [uncultured Sellimonas sp.]
MNRRTVALIAGLCMASAVVFTGCAPKEIENDYVKVKGYKGIEVQKINETKVTDSTVDDQIDQIRENYATYTEITDRAVQKGDVVTIDYTGKKDGVAFEGGTATDQQLEIGSGAFIPGFEDGIIGHKKGENFDINVTFPKDYGNEELNGKAVVFTINLKKIEQKELPELNDEFVTMVKGEKTTVSDYKKEIKSLLKDQAEAQNDSMKESAVTDSLMENVEVKKYPEKKVQNYKDMMTKQYRQIAESVNMEYADFIQQYTGMDEEKFDKQMDTQVKEVVKQQEVMALIAKEEEIKVSEKEVDKWLKDYAKAQQTTVDQLKEQNSEEEIKTQVLNEKVVDWLWDNAKIVEEKSDKDK